MDAMPDINVRAEEPKSITDVCLGLLSESNHTLYELICMLERRLSPVTDPNKKMKSYGLSDDKEETLASSPLVEHLHNENSKQHEMIQRVQDIIDSLDI